MAIIKICDPHYEYWHSPTGCEFESNINQHIQVLIQRMESLKISRSDKNISVKKRHSARNQLRCIKREYEKWMRYWGNRTERFRINGPNSFVIDEINKITENDKSISHVNICHYGSTHSDVIVFRTSLNQLFREIAYRNEIIKLYNVN